MLLQPPLEVLPSPAGMVVETALGDLDVLVRFTDYNYHVAVAAVIVADQVAGADLIPAWVVHPPPWEIAKRGVGTQRSPAGAVGAPVVGPAAVGAVGCGVHCPGGIDFPELHQGGPHTLRSNGSYGLHLVLVRLCAIDVNGVGGGIVGHAEVHRFADVPEPDVVVRTDAVGGHVHPLSIHVDGLGTQCDCDIGSCLRGGAA